jgi:hypothetical protein
MHYNIDVIPEKGAVPTEVQLTRYAKLVEHLQLGLNYEAMPYVGVKTYGQFEGLTLKQARQVVRNFPNVVVTVVIAQTDGAKGEDVLVHVDPLEAAVFAALFAAPTMEEIEPAIHRDLQSDVEGM